MRFDGQRTYPAEPETLRLLLNDPVALRNIIPGCQTLEASGPNDYQLCLTLRVGQNIETFDGTLTLDHAAPLGDIVFRAAGTVAHTAVTVSGHLALNWQPGGETLLTYEANAVADTPPAISSRLLQTTGRAFVRRCLEHLERQVAIRTRVYTTTAAIPVAAAPDSPAQHRAEVRRRLSFVALLAVLALLLGRGLGRRSRSTGATAEGSAA